MQPLVQILSNRDYPIGKIINQELEHSDSTHIAVAFLKSSGIKVIQDSLMMSLEKGAEFELIVGLDFKTTDPMAMKFFIDLHRQNKKVRCIKVIQIFVIILIATTIQRKKTKYYS